MRRGGLGGQVLLLASQGLDKYVCLAGGDAKGPLKAESARAKYELNKERERE